MTSEEIAGDYTLLIDVKTVLDYYHRRTDYALPIAQIHHSR